MKTSRGMRQSGSRRTKLPLSPRGINADSQEQPADEGVRRRRKGCRTVVYLANSPEVEGVSGKYFVKKRAVPSSPVCYDVATVKQLWENLLVDLTEAVRKIGCVRGDSVVSLATERLAQPRTGSLKFPKLLAERERPGEIKRVRDYVRGLKIYDGTLVSTDERASTILFYFVEDCSDRTASVNALREIGPTILIEVPAECSRSRCG